MKRTSRLLLFVLGLAALGAIVWFLVPSPFGRGVIVGMFGALGLLVGGLVIFGRIMRRRLGERLGPPPLPVGCWDYAMEVEDLTGAPVSFSRFSGKVLVLNFWATWCAPCLAEIPSLERLLDVTSDLDVEFACVTREEPEVVQTFVEKRGIRLPIYTLSGEPPACFKGRSIPATFVLDKTGMIALRHLGAASWDDESVVTFVRGLAATPA